MRQKDDHIKRLFNEKLKSFEADAPDSVWNRLEASLSQNSNPVFVKKQQRRRHIVKLTATVASIAAMVALLFTLINVDKNQDVPLQQFVESKKETQEQKEQKQPEKIEETPVEKLYTQEASKRSKIKHQNKQSVLVVLPERNNIAVEGKVEETTESKGIDTSETVNSQIEDKTNEESRIDREKVIADARREIDRINQTYGGQIDSLVSTSRNSSGFSVALNTRSNFALLNTIETSNVDGSSYLPQLYTKKANVKFKHYQPIAIGISASKKITPQIRLEAGISYIYVMSRVESDPAGEFNVNDRQVFHYLALPASVSYRFAEINKFKFQVAVGGTIQKDVYGLRKGKVPTVEGLENPLPENNMTKIAELEQEKAQLSMNATLGVAYPLYKKLNIYTTVGWAYYFDTDNKYKTIYSDRPHQLDLNVGLRYDF